LLNIMCNRFLFDHLRDLRTRQFALYLDSLRTTLDSLFSGVENAFFSAYKTYRFASLEIMNGITPTDGLMEQYLLRRNVLTDHVEYMGFFVSFFESYFGEAGRPVHMDILRQVVNTGKSYKALLDSLRLDYYFHSEELREAVSLTVLHHLYGTRGFRRDHILLMLRQAEKECGYPKHRSIASNILDMLTRFEQGSPAATFALPDHEEDTVRLHDLKGKFVYLIFFKTWNIAALNEMEMLRKLAPKYEHSVEFVGICCDREPMKMYHFVRDKKFPWRFLHFCNDHDLLEAYAVKSYPHFVLLDRQGRYIANPALFPSKNIEANLIECIRQEATD
jgi:peroxiredoxin